MNSYCRFSVWLSLHGMLGGCAIGYDSALFVTKSNLGLDLDTTPPTMELSISRREVAFAPTYPNGKTPPFYADFSSRSGAIKKFLFGLSSTFAGGEAAVEVSKKSAEIKQGNGANPPNPLPDSEKKAATETNPKVDSPNDNEKASCNLEEGCLCINAGKDQELYYDFLKLTKRKPSTPNEIRPFFYATDTVLGIKAVWSGTTAQYPDAVKVGYNRKEFAVPPIFVEPTSACTTETGLPGTHKIYMPPFFAWIYNYNDLTDIGNADNGYVQVFATGKAASQAARWMRDTVQRQVLSIVRNEDKNTQAVKSGTGNDTNDNQKKE